MKEIKLTKIFTALSLSLFAMTPFSSFADGEDKTSTVVADAYAGDVTQNVGNINITTGYFGNQARGISASAANGYTATVNAKDIDVNVNNNSIMYQKGIAAYCEMGDAGKINITTQNITSKDQGIDTISDGQECEVSITTNGDIQGGVYSDGYHFFKGIDAAAYENGKLDIVVNGDVSNRKLGAHVRGCGANNKGKVNVTVNGDVTASDTESGRGLTFQGTSDTADVLVTGVISGGKYGVNTNVYEFYYPELGVNKLTVWKISAPNNNLVVKQIDWHEAEESFEVDNDYAKEINYIIKHDPNVLPKKADRQPLETSHDLLVAHEGDKVIVDTDLDGVYVKKAFNNGIEITDKDADGYFYVVVPRGGGINLSIETDVAQNCTGESNYSQIGKSCNNGIAGTCFISGVYECNPATGKVECKLNDDIDGRIEFCGNNVDDDCDGVVDEEDCIDIPQELDTDGDGVPDNIDVCPNDPLNSLEMPVGGCFVDGSNIPERYDPKVPTDVVATPKTKPLPAFVLHNRSSVDVYYERFVGGAFKVDDKKLGKTKYEVMIKTKNKKKVTTKKVMQALSKNSRKFKPGKGVTITVQYRMVITKKVGKKNVTKRSKWSKAVKFQKMNLN